MSAQTYINKYGWIYYDDPPESVPIGDDKQHDWGFGCWCKPDDIEGVIAHNAADGRGDYEDGFKLPH